jgi:Asp/Glu/hydantoin racemase
VTIRCGATPPSTRSHQEALQQLIEAKTKGLTIKPRAVSTPLPVIDLMAALKRSLAQEIRAGARNGKKEANQARQHIGGSGRVVSCLGDTGVTGVRLMSALNIMGPGIGRLALHRA